jgi:hypothetical protein
MELTKRKISISKTLQNRGLTEEIILDLESRGLLRKYGINKSAEDKYIQFYWFKPENEIKENLVRRV